MFLKNGDESHGLKSKKKKRNITLIKQIQVKINGDLWLVGWWFG